MSLFGGFRSAPEKHPNLDSIAEAVHDNLGLQLATPEADVLPVIDALTQLDLIGFKNARSLEGMQEMFRRRSILASVDANARTLALAIASQEDIERELKAEHTAVNVLHVGEHKRPAQIIRPFGPIEPAKTEPSPVPAVAGANLESAPATAPPLPPAFEHLEAAERLCAVVVDLFVKHGQLTSADKDVLRKIKPLDYELESRVSALERWKAELSRRARGIHVTQTGGTSLLKTADPAAQKTEDAVLRRYDAFLHWLGKLIKAFEHKGIKFHGKPVWLPH